MLNKNNHNIDLIVKIEDDWLFLSLSQLDRWQYVPVQLLLIYLNVNRLFSLAV